MSTFLGNVLTLGAGRLIAQGISLAAIPVITRLYSAEEFGVFSLFASIVMVVSPVITLRFGAASMLPASDKDAFSLFILSLISSMMFFMLIILLMFFDAGWLTGLFGEKIVQVFWWIPAGILLASVLQAVMFWALRQGSFKLISIGAIGASIGDRVTVIMSASLVGSSVLWLVLGRITGTSVNLFIMLSSRYIRPTGALFTALKLGDLRRNILRYRDFPLFSTWGVLFSNVGREAPLILIAAFYSVAVAGAYGLGYRVLAAPLMLVGDAVGKAFLHRASKLQRTGETIRAETLKLFGSILQLALIPTVILIQFGGEIFSVAFGNEWLEAGEYSEILALAILGLLLDRVLSVLMIIFERQRLSMLQDIVMLVIRVLSICVPAIMGLPVEQALIMLCITSLAVYVWKLTYAAGLAGIDARHFAGVIVNRAFYIFPFVMVLVLFQSLNIRSIFQNVVCLFFAILAHVCFLFFADKEFRQITLKLVARKV